MRTSEQILTFLAKNKKLFPDKYQIIRIKGFRNIVAHNYFGIDAEDIWPIIKNKVPKLKTDIQGLL